MATLKKTSSRRPRRRTLKALSPAESRAEQSGGAYSDIENQIADPPADPDVQQLEEKPSLLARLFGSSSSEIQNQSPKDYSQSSPESQTSHSSDASFAAACERTPDVIGGADPDPGNAGAPDGAAGSAPSVRVDLLPPPEYFKQEDLAEDVRDFFTWLSEFRGVEAWAYGAKPSRAARVSRSLTPALNRAVDRMVHLLPDALAAKVEAAPEVVGLGNALTPIIAVGLLGEFNKWREGRISNRNNSTAGAGIAIGIPVSAESKGNLVNPVQANRL